jgi:uncharacterized integral membrane protein
MCIFTWGRFLTFSYMWYIWESIVMVTKMKLDILVDLYIRDTTNKKTAVFGMPSDVYECVSLCVCASTLICVCASVRAHLASAWVVGQKLFIFSVHSSVPGKYNILAQNNNFLKNSPNDDD